MPPAADNRRARLRQVRRVVIKIGSSSLTTATWALDRRVMAKLVGEVVALRQRGLEVALVSSGAVASGMGRLGLQARPQSVAALQALAAVGQNLLMHTYEGLFKKHGVLIGQVLLTAEDILDSRRRYLNLKNTFRQLFSYGAVPIINENDSVGVAELKRNIGDNDVLAAYVANMMQAQLLVLLSDVEGLYASYAPGAPAGEVLRQVEGADPKLDDLVGRSSNKVGRGGMATKLQAARLLTTCGEMALIAHARKHRLVEIMEGAELGTLFTPDHKRLQSRKRWIAFASHPAGAVVIDRGAQRALVSLGKSLLPVGVIACKGDFKAGEAIRVENEAGEEVARGLSRYAAAELRQILGKHSPEIAGLLGRPPVEVIHRDDLALLAGQR
jgi:glutamate 5-kinase